MTDQLPEHSPTPWIIPQPIVEGSGLAFTPILSTTLIAKVYSTAFGDHAQSLANARRIVACVNLLTGIPIEDIEGSIGDTALFGKMEYLMKIRRDREVAEEATQKLLAERLRIAKIINPDAIEVPHDGDLEIWARRCEDERQAYFGNLQAAIELMKKIIAEYDGLLDQLNEDREEPIFSGSDWLNAMRVFVKIHDINELLKEPK